jgi:hypothetical protein
MPAVSVPIPHSSVKVLPESVTACYSVASLDDTAVQLSDLADEVDSETSQRLARNVAGSGSAQKSGGPVGGETAVRPR